jgi:hypothetical protein
MKTGSQVELPPKRNQSLIEWIDGLGRLQLMGCGVAFYLVIVILFSSIEFYLDPTVNLPLPSKLPTGFPDLIYFNFVSILTIGYGDLSPKGVFKILTILEAITGLAIYSLTISIITIKLLLPKKDTIVFSKYAYYCETEDAFMIIYLNTAKQYLTNAETSWYFKLNEDWKTLPPSKVPFITKSVQTFKLEFLPLKEIKTRLHEHDCLRVAITGSLGPGIYSTFIQYDLSDILVIKDRSELTAYPGFYQVDKYLSDPDFQHYFHYAPVQAVKMSEYCKRETTPVA